MAQPSGVAPGRKKGPRPSGDLHNASGFDVKKIYVLVVSLWRCLHEVLDLAVQQRAAHLGRGISPKQPTDVSQF